MRPGRMMMKLRNEDLRKIYQSSEGDTSGVHEACPPVEVLIKSFSPEMNEEEKLQVVDHVTECDYCRWIFEAVREIVKEIKAAASEAGGQPLSESEVTGLKQRAQERIRELEGRFDRGKKTSLLENWRAYLGEHRVASLAAGLFVILLAALLVLKSPLKKGENVLRGEDEPTVNLETPQGLKEKLPVFFRWQAYPGATGYEVKVFDETLDEIWGSGRTTATSLELPASVAETLNKEAVYYWKITVYSDKEIIKESGLQEFKLKG
jgi:hypothetical protein